MWESVGRHVNDLLHLLASKLADLWSPLILAQVAVKENVLLQVRHRRRKNEPPWVHHRPQVSLITLLAEDHRELPVKVVLAPCE